jgi:hypothetical protein
LAQYDFTLHTSSVRAVDHGICCLSGPRASGAGG